MFTNLLVAIDGSAHAQRALDHAIDLAQPHSSKLTIITCVPEPSAWTIAGGAYAGIDYTRLQHDLDHEHQQLLDQAAATTPDTLPTTTILAHGHPAQQILHHAHAGHHDLIIMGSRGRDGMRSLILGSTSHQVLNASPHAVLITHN
jgi:nucleotide-binding universal stress UspA family protein